MARVRICFAAILAVCCHVGYARGSPEGVEGLNGFAADMWIEGVDVARVLWKDCSKMIFAKNDTGVRQEHFSTLAKCVKKKTLRALDRTLDADVISLTPGVHLVKYEQLNKEGKIPRHKGDDKKIDETMLEGDWRYLVINRMARVFDTHVLKFDFQDRKEEKVESRHRRRHHMMQMMMFGIMSMGMILVPMGFQFLAVLGGKAILLAKLALILSSIQGLKKIATSPVNYGFYQYPVHEGHIEKRGHDWSRPQIKHEEPASHERIKYRYDGDSRLWKPDSTRTSKRSAYPYTPVYPVYPHNYGHQMSPFLPSEPYNVEENPTEIHAEYTIDLPVNKVQFKSGAPPVQT